MREVGPSIIFGPGDDHDGGVVGDVEGVALGPQGLGGVYSIMFYGV